MKPTQNDNRHTLVIDTLAAIGVHIAPGVIQGRMCARVMTTAKVARHAA